MYMSIVYNIFRYLVELNRFESDQSPKFRSSRPGLCWEEKPGDSTCTQVEVKMGSETDVAQKAMDVEVSQIHPTLEAAAAVMIHHLG